MKSKKGQQNRSPVNKGGEKQGEQGGWGEKKDLNWRDETVSKKSRGPRNNRVKKEKEGHDSITRARSHGTPRIKKGNDRKTRDQNVMTRGGKLGPGA